MHTETDHTQTRSYFGGLICPLLPSLQPLWGKTWTMICFTLSLILFPPTPPTSAQTEPGKAGVANAPGGWSLSHTVRGGWGGDEAAMLSQHGTFLLKLCRGSLMLEGDEDGVEGNSGNFNHVQIRWGVHWWSNMAGGAAAALCVSIQNKNHCVAQVPLAL